MDLNSFLNGAGITYRDLLASVRASLSVNDTDAVLIVGSLTEGLGCSKSDLDIWLVSDRYRSTRIRDVALILNGRVVDIKCVSARYLNQLVRKLESWGRSNWEVSSAAQFSIDERVLLHRLHFGQSIFSPFTTPAIQLRRPSLHDLARLKLHVARQMTRTIQVDLVGYREVRDYRSMVFASQELLGHSADALSAAYFLTNPLPKWRARLLKTIPAKWIGNLSRLGAGQRATQVYWQLHRAPFESTKRDALQHALRCVSFARGVFFSAELKLVRSEKAIRPASTTKLPCVDPAPGSLPCLDLDIDYCITDDGGLFGRLNAFDDSVSLSADELRLAFLFDGNNTWAEIRNSYGSRIVSQIEALSERLAPYLVKRGNI